MAHVQQQHHPQHHVTGWTGWLAFVSIFMLLVGTMHVIFGIAAILQNSWYVYASGSTYVLGSTGLGWSVLIGGILMILTSLLLASGNMAGRVLAGIFATGALLANIALLPVAPVWAVLAIVFDAFILYAVIAHGGEMKHLEDKV